VIPHRQTSYSRRLNKVGRRSLTRMTATVEYYMYQFLESETFRFLWGDHFVVCHRSQTSTKRSTCGTPYSSQKSSICLDNDPSNLSTGRWFTHSAFSKVNTLNITIDATQCWGLHEIYERWRHLTITELYELEMRSMTFATRSNHSYTPAVIRNGHNDVNHIGDIDDWEVHTSLQVGNGQDSEWDQRCLRWSGCTHRLWVRNEVNVSCDARVSHSCGWEIDRYEDNAAINQ